MANNNTVRISTPRNPTEFLGLCAELVKKHKEDGADSPLNVIKGFNWETVANIVEDANACSKEASDLKTRAATLNQKRDADIEQLKPVLEAAKKTLSGVHHQNQRKLSEWGFTVTTTTPKPSPKSGKLKKE